MTTSRSNLRGTQQRDWIVRISIAATASLLAAVVGPFSTYSHFSFLERLLYWGGVIMGLLVPAYMLRIAICRVIVGSQTRRDFIAAIVLSGVIGGSVWLFNLLIMGFAVAGLGSYLEHTLVALAVCFIPVAIRAYVRMTLGEIETRTKVVVVGTPDPEAQTVSEDAPFLRRIEPEKRGPVRQVSADGHHLRVWTEAGSSKLRLRFSDALVELAEFEGAQVHRSHWVAFGAIASVEPDGRRHKVRLDCGVQLPVSVNGLKALMEAGFLVEAPSDDVPRGA